MKYAILKRQHEACDLKLMQELSDLYAGGYQIRRRAREYLPKMRAETFDQYEERLREASYLGYLGQIIDFFAANLFSQELSIKPPADADDKTTVGELPDVDYYTTFESDCDRKGTSFPKLLRAVFANALLKGRAQVAVDFPVVDAEIATRADEDRSGKAHAYAFEVPVEQLINWAYDDAGDFEWVVLNRIQTVQYGPFAAVPVIREEFKVWQKDAGGRVSWQLYAIEYDAKEPPKPETDIPLVGEGMTSFRRVPLVELALPTGLWIGNKLGPLACEHFRRRSNLNAAESRSLYEIPVYKLGSEIGAPDAEIPSEAQQDPHRARDPRAQLHAKGCVAIGKDDELLFVGPSGKAYEIVDRQLASLKDEMFRVVHQMAAAVGVDSGTLGRSGLSKQEDRRAEAIVLEEFGRLVRDFAVKIYRVISEARGEDVVWVAHGLDKFEVEDRALTLQEGMQLDAVPIPSPTFRKEYKTRIALKLLPGIPPETQEVIRQEIEEGVDREDEQREHEIMLTNAMSAGIEDAAETGASTT